MGIWDGDDDGSRPTWLPHFMRLSKDSMKQRPKFTHIDLKEIEHFAHNTQVLVLTICVIWAVSWCCCWQLSDYRRERKRQALIREAMKNE
mmetsp:Transcript_4071/g.5175  ORF Transcript_4071/g.5175 Transcript_4071/m.5175 type:complete len:90 (+) Transcript_4071:67-336(+)